MTALHFFNRVSAWRRGLNSHEAIPPRLQVCRRQCIVQPAVELRVQGLQIQAPCHSRVSTKDKNSLRQVGAEFRVGNLGIQSILGAAAIRSAIGLHTRGGNLQPLVVEAGGNMRRALKTAVPPGLLECQQRPRPYSEKPSAPNPSLKLSTNGRPPGPGHRYGVHSLWPGPGVLPLVPA